MITLQAEQSGAEQSVLNVQTLGCSHHKRSGAARSRAEESGTLGKFRDIFCCSLLAGQEAINKDKYRGVYRAVACPTCSVGKSSPRLPKSRYP
ncbi:hypothetical protein E2C01_092512 [Portunus trituberculatus]|uniref:Uncharacterized protein n=1 Tax=Portunus trituberculatus TaxID=210409 RepID=A0A5B7JGN4_PORTR|nr:hypothetical protein [Portunus trituberculatus]